MSPPKILALGAAAAVPGKTVIVPLLGNLGEGELIEDAGLQGGMLTGRRRSLRRGRIGTRWFHRRELAEVRARSTCIERLPYQSFPEGTGR